MFKPIQDNWLGNKARGSDLKPPQSVDYAGLVGTQFFRLSERLCQKCKLNETNQSSWRYLVVVNGGCILPRGLCPYVQKMDYRLHLEELHEDAVRAKFDNIWSDDNHPLHNCFRLLPHGIRLNVPGSKTNRL